MLEQKIKSVIRDVPDFPKPGILFRDITPIFQNPALHNSITEELNKIYLHEKIDLIIGVESRGFMFGFALAQKLHIPFILVRKAGKLPFKTVSYEYDLEYGKSKIEMHADAVAPGSNILIHDDLLATGGTAAATAELVKMQGGNVAGFSFLVELKFLKGRERLSKYSDNIISLVKYE
jgi:adenine phosphoribosyltransferase